MPAINDMMAKFSAGAIVAERGGSRSPKNETRSAVEKPRGESGGENEGQARGDPASIEVAPPSHVFAPMLPREAMEARKAWEVADRDCQGEVAIVVLRLPSGKPYKAIPLAEYVEFFEAGNQ